MPLRSVLGIAFASVVAAPLFASDAGVTPMVTVHEWGTFTSVAGPDGSAVPWAALAATSDLPCFVHELGNRNFKFISRGLERMETPVVYFYSPVPATVSVQVGFPQGWITEWYPRASRTSPEQAVSGIPPDSGFLIKGLIEWSGLTLHPGLSLPLPHGMGDSRYYAARATDSVMLQSGNEREKLLFYRGIGSFPVKLEPVISGNSVVLRNRGDAPLPLAMIFANEDGRIGYRMVRNLEQSVTVPAPDLTASPDHLRADLEGALVQAGLYPKEAAAMLDTWHDSWFEPGMRVFYLMPRERVNSVLPLTVSPAPKETQRVFVGRVEVLSPWTERTLRAAISSQDVATLDRFGRFAEPFLSQMAISRSSEPQAWLTHLQQAASAEGFSACIK